jgi:hypothetical protein
MWSCVFVGALRPKHRKSRNPVSRRPLRRRHVDPKLLSYASLCSIGACIPSDQGATSDTIVSINITRFTIESDKHDRESLACR